jgi:hypothetical protein
MSKKLQNIKAINEMLNGEHKFQTKKRVALNTKQRETRLVGETWEEVDSITGITYIYQQADGFQIKRIKSSAELQNVRNELVEFKNCPKDVCTCINPTRLDKKMQSHHAMCFDCVVEFEHELRKHDKFSDYAKNKIVENALAWLRQAEQDVCMLKDAYTKSYDVVTNGDGRTETISARMTPEQFSEQVEMQFAKFKEEFLLKLKGQDDE